MLTEEQKANIRLYLGYPDYFRSRHTRLESVLLNLSSESETLIATCLAKLVEIEANLLDAGTTNAGVKRVDEIWFDNGAKRATEIRKLGRQYVSRISIILGVPIYSDVFGGTGYLGDGFSGLGGRGSNGGWFGLG